MGALEIAAFIEPRQNYGRNGKYYAVSEQLWEGNLQQFANLGLGAERIGESQDQIKRFSNDLKQGQSLPEDISLDIAALEVLNKEIRYEKFGFKTA